MQSNPSHKSDGALCYFMVCTAQPTVHVRFRNGDVRGYCKPHADEILWRAANAPYSRNSLHGAVVVSVTK